MLITLLTDFGTSDYFVAAMKGRILTIAPAIVMVDLSHDVSPHDIEAGAFILGAVYQDFPLGTIHLAVIDPGVGSDRLPIVVSACGQLFVGPDNGLFSGILESDPDAEVREIELGSEDVIGATFHGRDIFAPAAARLATGLPFEDMGRIVVDPVRTRGGVVAAEEDGTILGRVIHVDHFGNCVTNLPATLPSGPESTAEVAGNVISQFREYYEASGDPGPFLIRGSAGFIEISMLRASAADRLGVRVGDPVRYRAGSRGSGEADSLLRLP